MKQVTTTQEIAFAGDIPLPVTMSVAIAIHLLDPESGLFNDPKSGEEARFCHSNQLYCKYFGLVP